MNLKYAFLAVVIFNLQLGSAMSALFGVNPIQLNFSQDRRIETLTINNAEDQPLVVHLKVMAWSQKNGEDKYDPTTDIFAVPNVVTIQPKSSQVIRIKNKLRPDPRLEKAYRVYVHELPVKKASDPKEKKKPLNFIMCMGIPIFVEPIAPMNEKIQVALEWDHGVLKLKNLGVKHIHMRKLRHHPHEKQPRDIFQYVLPQQSVPVDLPKAATLNGSKFVFHIDDEVVELNVPRKP